MIIINNGQKSNNNMNGGNQNGGAYHRHPGHSGQQQRHTRVRFPEEFDAGDGDGGGGGGGGPFDLFARVFSTLTGLFFGAIASICLLGLLTILGILYVVVRPFSVSTYRRVANQLAASSFLDAMALLLPNMRLYLTGDSDVPSPVGTSILVCNHLMDGDWWPILMLGRCVGLRGSVKAILRNEILHLNVQNATANGSSNVNPSSNSAGQQETPRDRRSSTGAQLNTALLKQATAVLGGSMPNNNKNNNGIVPFVRTNTPEPLHTTGSNSSSPSPSSQTSNSGFNSRGTHHHTSRDLAILAKLLHAFMEFPLLNGEDYISDREHLFQLLRSFAENNGAEAPVHLLFFPEGWSLHNGADRRSILAMSNEFAKREGRPQLKHLLLPKTTGFNASLECLRESSPVVYDVTMAFSGYDGSLPPKFNLSFTALWSLMRQSFPTEIHIRIKRYSMEEVLQDATWLDKKWAEKDRLLNFFASHESFPTDGRGFCRHRVFNTRTHSIEGSIVALVRLLAMPWAIPFLLFLSIPLFWTVLWIYLIHRGFKAIFPDSDTDGPLTSGDEVGSAGIAGQTPRSESAAGTPFFPATPFVSPSVANWRDMISNRGKDQNGKK